jgi:hypothetical protein
MVKMGGLYKPGFGGWRVELDRFFSCSMRPNGGVSIDLQIEIQIQRDDSNGRTNLIKTESRDRDKEEEISHELLFYEREV